MPGEATSFAHAQAGDVVYATEGFLGVGDPLRAGQFLHQMIEGVGLGEVLEGREDALPGRRKAARKSGIEAFLTTTLAALDVTRRYGRR